MQSTYLTTREVAVRLGICTRTVRRAVQRGTLTPTVRTPGGHGRFAFADVEAYAQQGINWHTAPGAGTRS